MHIQPSAGPGLRMRLTSRPPSQPGDLINYGHHFAAGTALGFLFLGGGLRTFGTGDEAVAALVAAIYPVYPDDPRDQRYHLQVIIKPTPILLIQPLRASQTTRAPTTRMASATTLRCQPLVARGLLECWGRGRAVWAQGRCFTVPQGPRLQSLSHNKLKSCENQMALWHARRRCATCTCWRRSRAA